MNPLNLIRNFSDAKPGGPSVGTCGAFFAGFVVVFGLFSIIAMAVRAVS